jgi:hypothetical protein
MKALVVTAAATVLIAGLASPAFAASKKRNQVSNEAARTYGAANPRGPYTPNGSVVIFGNRVIGQDPDPNIRLQMRRDPYPGNY